MALPRWRAPFGWMPESPWWALVPAGSIVVVVFGIEAAPGSAEGLTWLALLAVPPLAALALGWLVRGSRPAWALAVAPLFAVAWLASQEALAGEAAATLLSGLACVSLGWLLASVVPARWLRLGIYAMATVDAILIAAELLQGPSSLLSAAAPAGLPRLQVLELGSARMGFGDAFVAATAGALLALPALPADGPKSGAELNFSAPRRQLWGAALIAALGLGFDLLFFALDTLPATVPVALGLAVAGRLSVGVADERDRVDRGEAGDRQRHPQP